MVFQGEVIRRPFAVGSKSEHDAVMLQCDRGVFKLRRADGNPFHDPELERLVGKRVCCEGSINDYLLVVTDIKEC